MGDNKGAAEMVDRKLKVGDKVKVVEYGHLLFRYKKGYQEESDYFAKAQAEFNNNMAKALFGEHTIFEDVESVKGKPEPDNIYKDCGDVWWIDINPGLVGQEGVVSKVTNTQGRLQYAVDGISGKHAWYDEKQLELVKTESLDRKEGYYWVRLGDVWSIAEYHKGKHDDWWIMFGERDGCWSGSKDFCEIDERQICRS